jgi:hypothetical protein
MAPVPPCPPGFVLFFTCSSHPVVAVSAKAHTRLSHPIVALDVCIAFSSSKQPVSVLEARSCK